MKRLILGVCALLLLTFGPVPSASAWWWHHKAKPADATGAGASKKDKKTKVERTKHSRENHTPLYTKPKSRGWRHHSPGPMGAGSGEQ
ncbi:MAG TPA: hypothetical protein VEJ47_22320 [Candidatus Eremiobacteraceae bacterium]|nr:hypothetical protein [Candidatus Eremiobacteraceae bacterium]